MDKQEIDDYLYYEFNVSSPSELSESFRFIAYERLKIKLKMDNLSPDEYTRQIMNLSDHLDI